MPIRTFNIRDKQDGTTYKLPWDRPKPPSRDEIRLFLDEERRKRDRGSLEKAWDWANEPLSDIGSRTAKRVADYVTTPEEDDANEWFGAKPYLKGFAGGAAQGIGNLVDTFTSPAGIASTAATGGAYGAGRAGLVGTARALSAADMAINAPTVAHGMVESARGAGLGDQDRAYQGLAEAAFGAAGVGLGSLTMPTTQRLAADAARRAAKAASQQPTSLGRVVPPPSRVVPPPAATVAPPPPVVPPPVVAPPPVVPSGRTPKLRGKKGKAAGDAARLAREAAEAARRAAAPPVAETVVPPTSPVAPAPVPRTPGRLPRDLAGAAPRYRAHIPVFEDDVDKALYIVAQKNPSPRNADYLKFLEEETGMTPAEAIAEGLRLKSQLKIGMKGQPEGEVPVPSYYRSLSKSAPTLGSAAEALPVNKPKRTRKKVEVDEVVPSSDVSPEIIPGSDNPKVQKLVGKLKGVLEKKKAGIGDITAAPGEQIGDITAPPAPRRGLPNLLGDETGAVRIRSGGPLRQTKDVDRALAKKEGQLRLAKREHAKETDWKKLGALESRMADLTREIDQLAGPEGKKDIRNRRVVEDFRESLPEATEPTRRDTRFILPDGSRLTHKTRSHAAASLEVGHKLDDILDAGIVRVAESYDGAEISAPLTRQQAEQLADLSHFADKPGVYADVRMPDGSIREEYFQRGASADDIQSWVNRQFREGRRPSLLGDETGAIRIRPGGPLGKAQRVETPEPTLLPSGNDEMANRMGYEHDDYVVHGTTRGAEEALTSATDAIDQLYYGKYQMNPPPQVKKLHDLLSSAEGDRRFYQRGGTDPMSYLDNMGETLEKLSKTNFDAWPEPYKKQYDALVELYNQHRGYTDNEYRYRRVADIDVGPAPKKTDIYSEIKAAHDEDLIVFPPGNKTDKSGYVPVRKLSDGSIAARRKMPGETPSNLQGPWMGRKALPDIEEAPKAKTRGERPGIMDEKGFIRNPFAKRGPQPYSRRTKWREEIFPITREKRQGEPGDMTRFREVFQRYVNSRSAAKVAGRKVKESLNDLSPEGIKAIQDYEAGNRAGKLADVQVFSDRWDRAFANRKKKPTMDINHDLWDNTDAEIVRALGPGALQAQEFNFNNVVKAYTSGINVGLKPRYTTMGELASLFENKGTKKIANRSFKSEMESSGLVFPKKLAASMGRSVVPITNPRSPVKGYAQPYVVQALENYLGEGGKPLQLTSNIAQGAKNLALAAGIPGTGFSGHGINMIVRNTASRGLMKSGKQLIQSLKWAVNTGAENKISQTIEKLAPWQSARKSMLDNLDEAEDFVQHGMTLSSEDFNFQEKGKVWEALDKLGFSKLTDFHTKTFEDPLFQNVVPAMKIDFAKNARSQMMAQGVPATEATRRAAVQANDMFGGMNWDEVGSSKDFMNLMRSVVLAPDWAATHLRHGKGISNWVKDPKDPRYETYKSLTTGLLSMYVAGNVLNYMNSGHFMFQNDPGQTFNIEMGKTKNSEGEDVKRYLNLFGTAADVYRLPSDIAVSLSEGEGGAMWRMGRGRLSLPLSALGGAIFNVDRYNRPLSGVDAFGRQIPPEQQAANYAGQLFTPFTPQYVKPIVARAAREIGGKGYGQPYSAEQIATQAVELPVRYGTDPNVRRNKKKKRSMF